MKQHTIISAVLLAMSATAFAQETYESALVATEDINGTARYIGMGGAMEALGADISTIRTNPAGIGMFRSSWIGTTFGLSALEKQESQVRPGETLANSGKTVPSLDQIGFVVSYRTSESNYVNFALSYNKSRNFNQIISAVSPLNGSSLNCHSYIGAYNDYQATLYDDLFDASFLKSPVENENGEVTTEYGYMDATDYVYRREQKGYIGEYDLNLSGNCKDRFYWGITMGIKDVRYKGATEYEEWVVGHEYDDNGNVAGEFEAGSVFLSDLREITGYGVDVKAGIIVRPIEGSPFRIGASISSPTWYTLTSSNSTTLYNNTPYGLVPFKPYSNGESYKYRMDTPWKFGLSLGHTVGNVLAIGASYEYADYSTIDNRVIDGRDIDYFGEYHESSSSDIVMNNNTERCLQGMHTFKIGAEYKLFPELAVRAGYNCLSAMYKDNGARDFSFDADGVYYSSTADYTNWKDRQSLTLGVGYSKNGVSIDLAYMNTTQKGDFHPFPTSSINDVNEDGSPYYLINSADAVKVKNNRHQFVLTLGYRF